MSDAEQRLLASIIVCSSHPSIMMAGPPSKKMRNSAESSFDLMGLGRASFVSKSGIAGLLSAVKKDGIPSSFDRRTQYRARKRVASTETPYGKLVDTLPLPDGETIAVQNPLAFLWYNCQKSPDYAEMIRQSLERSPSSPASPWNLILYQDGVDPSDGLSNNHSRKSCVWYWSFLELGLRDLAKEEVWGTLCVMRASRASKLPGGITTLFGKLLGFFFGTTDIRLAGVPVILDGSKRGEQPLQRHIFAQVGCLLADMPALKEMLNCKGHGGHKCCCLCRNATNTGIPGIPLHLTCTAAVPITTFDLSLFDKYTDENMRDTLRRLEAHHDSFVAGDMTKHDFEMREIVLGWTWVPDNPILVPKFRLNIASCVMFDWAHVYVNDGVADAEFGRCMKVMHSHRSQSSYCNLREYIARFTLPKCAPAISRLFSDSAIKNNLRKVSFTCSFRECLTLAPIALRYFERVVAARNECEQHVASMIAVLQVVVILTELKAGSVSAATLTAAVRKHLDLFLPAYGEDAVRPKHHYAAHLGPMLEKFHLLLSTFLQERKHRVVKKYTRDRRNLTNWDLGAVEKVTCHQLWELDRPLLEEYATVEPRGKMKDVLKEVFPEATDTWLVRDIAVHGGVANVGDVVTCFLDDKVLGELLLSVLVSEQGVEVPYSLVAVWDIASEHPSWPTYSVSEHRVLKLHVSRVDRVHTYSMSLDRKSCVVYDP